MAKAAKPTSWKISDVSDEAREIARTSARASKQTIGRWLSSVILTATEQSVQDGSSPADGSPPPQSGPDLSEIEARLLRSIDHSQARSASEIGTLQNTLSRLDERLQEIEKRRNSG